jgi:hypothetical protein
MAQLLIQTQPRLNAESLAERELMVYQLFRCTAKFPLRD